MFKKPVSGFMSATMPHVSIGDGCTRGSMMSRVTIVSASAKTRSVAPLSPASHVGLARLSVWPTLSSRISGASGSSALRALTIAGSTSYSTSISASASCAE
jgi:hypothetical protein